MGEKVDLPAAIKALSTDLIAIQEIDYKLPRSGTTNQIKEIAESMAGGQHNWCFAPTVIGTPGEKWIRPQDTHLITKANELSASENREGCYGIAIATTLAVKSFERLELGRSLIGLPLLVNADKARFIYVKDEPRVALAAHLENGWTVINTHLSFVPLVNLFQLAKIKRWAKKIARESGQKCLIVGDLNLPFLFGKKWRSLNSRKSYPSWGPKVQFDYILGTGDGFTSAAIETPRTNISDHIALSAEIVEVR